MRFDFVKLIGSAALLAIVNLTINTAHAADDVADPAADMASVAEEATADDGMLLASDVGDTVDCEDLCCCNVGLLGGLIKPSDTCFCDFISPITNPVFFEDPRTLTEARIIYLHHWLPEDVTGGELDVVAMQLRAALSDRLSIVAAKDGYIWASPGAPLDDGWADISLGLKYNLLADDCSGTIVSAGVSYELPIGSTRALQGNGDGEFNVYLTGGKRIGCNAHWISATGFRLPTDTSDENQVWYWSNHVDYHLGCGWYVLAEANWYHWLSSGDQAAFAGIEGLDLFNLGSTNVAGDDIVTGALGAKYKPSCCTEIGVAWETHLTDNRGVIEDRLTIDWIIRY